MIAGLAQGYSISSLGEIFQGLLSIWGFTVNLLNLLEYVKYFEFSLISINQYNINFAWPYTADSIDCQLTQLFPHMFIQAFTDYWSVKASSQLGHMS